MSKDVQPEAPEKPEQKNDAPAESTAKETEATVAADNLRNDSGINGDDVTNGTSGTDTDTLAGKTAEAEKDLEKESEDDKKKTEDRLLEASRDPNVAKTVFARGETLDEASKKAFGDLELTEGERKSKDKIAGNDETVTYDNKDVTLILGGKDGLTITNDDAHWTLNPYNAEGNVTADVALKAGKNVNSEKRGDFTRHSLKDGSGAAAYENADGNVFVRTAEGKYITMSNGAYGEVVEGADAQKAFEQTAKQFHNLELTDAATVQAKNGEDFKASDKDGELISAGGVSARQHKNGNVTILEDGKVTELTGDAASQKWGELAKTFETDMPDGKPAGGDIADSSSWGLGEFRDLAKAGLQYISNPVLATATAAYDYAISPANADEIAGADTNTETSEAAKDLADAGTSDDGLFTWDGFVSGVQSAGDWMGFDGSFGYDGTWGIDENSADFSGDEAIKNANLPKEVNHELPNGDDMVNAMRKLLGDQAQGENGDGFTANDLGKFLTENYQSGPFEGLDPSKVTDRTKDHNGETIETPDGKQRVLKFETAEDGRERIETENTVVERFADGMQKFTNKETGDVTYKDKAGNMLTVDGPGKDGSTHFKGADGSRRDSLVTGDGSDPLNVEQHDEYDESKIKAGSFSQFGEGEDYYTRTPGGDIVRFSKGENGQVMAEVTMDDGTKWRGSSKDIANGNNQNIEIQKPGEEWRAATSQERREMGIDYYGPPTRNGSHPNALGLHFNDQGIPTGLNGAHFTNRDGRLRLQKRKAFVERLANGDRVQRDARGRTETIKPSGDSTTTNADGDTVSTWSQADRKLTSIDPDTGKAVFELGPNSAYINEADMTMGNDGDLFNGRSTDESNRFYDASENSFDTAAYSGYTGWMGDNYAGNSGIMVNGMSLEEYEQARAQKADAEGVSGQGLAFASGGISTGNFSGLQIGKAFALKALGMVGGLPPAMASQIISMAGQTLGLANIGEGILQAFNHRGGGSHGKLSFENALKRGPRFLADPTVTLAYTEMDMRIQNKDSEAQQRVFGTA